VCLAETEAICNALAQFRDKLIAAGLSTAAAKEKHPESAEWVREQLAALKDACTLGDSGVADAIAAELESAHVDGETDKRIAEIVRAAASFDYDKAILDIETLS
jgi:hypothetical protein